MKRLAVAALLATAIAGAAGCGSAGTAVDSLTRVSHAVGGGPELAGQVQVVAYSGRKFASAPRRRSCGPPAEATGL